MILILSLYLSIYLSILFTLLCIDININNIIISDMQREIQQAKCILFFISLLLSSIKSVSVPHPVRLFASANAIYVNSREIEIYKFDLNLTTEIASI